MGTDLSPVHAGGIEHEVDIPLPVDDDHAAIAAKARYFIERNLFPNIDFYSGIIYQAAGFPVEMFPVLFAIPRTVGWMAQWREMITDPEQRIARPRQVYIGEGPRDYVPLADRA